MSILITAKVNKDVREDVNYVGKASITISDSSKSQGKEVQLDLISFNALIKVNKKDELYVDFPGYLSSKTTVTPEGKEVREKKSFVSPVSSDAYEEIKSAMLAAYDNPGLKVVTKSKVCKDKEVGINAKAFLNENNESNRIANVTLYLGEKYLAVNGASLMSGKNGEFLSMPAVKINNNGETDYVDMVHPASKEAAAMMRNAAIQACDMELAEMRNNVGRAK